MSLSNSFFRLITLVIFSFGVMPTVNAMDAINSNGTDALNSTGNGKNECPEDQSCWAEYKGKWKKQLNGEDVRRKVGNAIYDVARQIWDGTEYKEFKDTIYDQRQINSMEQFMEYAIMPACGNPYHEFMKDCAKKYFYMGKKPAESEVMTTDDKFKKVHLLALLEACFICGDGHVQSEISVEVIYRWPAGSFFSNCEEEQNAALTNVVILIERFE